MRPRVAEGPELEEWDAWLETSDGANLRQTSGYREALTLFGHRSEILLCDRGGELESGALVGVRDTLPGLGSILHTSGGWASRDIYDAASLDRFLETLLAFGLEVGASTIDVFLRAPRRVGDAEIAAAKALESVLSDKGFVLRERFDTYYVRLGDRSDEELLRALGKNPRRHIRRGRREGLTVDRTLSERDFFDFEEAHETMSRRKKLKPLPKGFLSGCIYRLAQSGRGDLFVARFRDVPRNYAFVSSLGPSIYLWGALSERAREGGCPQTGQSLHYEVMRRAKMRGCQVYDFGGTPGPTPDPSHPNYSVWKFKHEFEGDYVSFLGWFRCRLRPVGAAFTDVLRKAVDFKRRAFGA